MTPDAGTDSLLAQVARLPAIRPDPARADCGRARAIALLVQQQRPVRATKNRRGVQRGLGQALLGGVCLIYLLMVIGNALRYF